MPLFGKGPQKRRSGERGPAKSGEDRLKRAQAKAVELALRQRPELADQIAMQALGLRAQETADPFDQFMDRLEKFRGIMPDVEATQRPSGLIDWQALGAGLASVLVGLANAGAFGARPGGAPALGAAPGDPAADRVAAAAGGQPEAPEGAPTTSPAAAVAERRRFDPLPRPATWQSRLAHAMLEGTTPGEAAAILASQQSYDIPAIIDVLVTVPDGELVVYVGRLAAKHPPLAPMFRWLVADPEWSVEVVRELRRVRGVEAPAA